MLVLPAGVGRCAASSSPATPPGCWGWGSAPTPRFAAFRPPPPVPGLNKSGHRPNLTPFCVRALAQQMYETYGSDRLGPCLFSYEYTYSPEGGKNTHFLFLHQSSSSSSSLSSSPLPFPLISSSSSSSVALCFPIMRPLVVGPHYKFIDFPFVQN